MKYSQGLTFTLPHGVTEIKLIVGRIGFPTPPIDKSSETTP